MKHKYFVLTIVGFFCFTLSILCIFRNKISKHSVDDVIARTLIDFHNPMEVHKIQVIGGNEYDLSLKDGRRIKAVLGVITTPDAKDKVVDFLNRSKNPRVILKKQDSGIWLVSLYVTAKDSFNEDIEIDLSVWLKEKNLVYN